MNDFLHNEEEFTSRKIDWNVWKKIFSYMKPLKKYVILAILCMLILAATDVIYPYIARFTIDDIITPNIVNGTQDLSKLKLFIGLYLIFMVIQASMVFLFIRYAGKIQ